MRRNKKPFQEKIQSRGQSYCAWWTKGTMCLNASAPALTRRHQTSTRPPGLFPPFSGTEWIFSRIFSCRKYPRDGPNRIRWSVLVRRAGLRPTEQTNPTKRTASSQRRRTEEPTKTGRRHGRQEPGSGLPSLSAAVSVTEPGRRLRSPPPLRSELQTNSHSSTRTASGCLRGRVLPLPDFQADFTLTCSFTKQTHFKASEKLGPRSQTRTSMVFLLRKWRAKSRDSGAPRLRRSEREGRRERRREGGES